MSKKANVIDFAAYRAAKARQDAKEPASQESPASPGTLLYWRAAVLYAPAFGWMIPNDTR